MVEMIITLITVMSIFILAGITSYGLITIIFEKNIFNIEYDKDGFSALVCLFWGTFFILYMMVFY